MAGGPDVQGQGPDASSVHLGPHAELRKTAAQTGLAAAVRQVALAMAAYVARAVVPLREPPGALAVALAVALAAAWAAAWVAAVGVTSAAWAVALAALAALHALVPTSQQHQRGAAP